MYLFFIKKNFYDGWDNMLLLIVINLVIMTVSLGLLSLIYALQQSVNHAARGRIPVAGEDILAV